MTTAAVVGAGEIGGTVARAIAASDRVNRVVVVDPRAAAAAGKALDIQQAGPIAGFHTRLAATDDISTLAACAVCIVADSLSSSDGVDDDAALMRRIAPYLGATPIVFAGASHADLIQYAGTEIGLNRARLIGSAVEAAASTIKALVALETECSPRDVMLTVLGRPPYGLVVRWSEASVGGYALQDLLSQAALARIEARARHMWPPGPYALGTAAARFAEAIVCSSRQFFSAVTLLAGEFGVRNRPGALPVRLGPAGITHTRVPRLTPREGVQLQVALGG